MKAKTSEKPDKQRSLPGRAFRAILIAHLLFLLPILFGLTSYLLGVEDRDWWQPQSAGSERAHGDQAPDPAQHKDAIIQVYAARAGRWRGALGVHTWFAVKPINADRYTRLEVFGFNLRRYGNTVSINQRSPDRYWFGNTPTLLREIRGGVEVEDMINRLYEAAEQYPYDEHYRLWPGPNSNTFIASLGRAVPELRLELPVTAIGKDYLANGTIFDHTPSGTGIQVSLGGIFGFMIGLEEGIEVTLLGFSAGVDLSPPAIKLPAIGRIGFSDFTSVATTN